ncbi:GNAT family N-acetyltransferase [Nocardiopsis ansamitocini]|uniref:N-acetyltransferase n=1 Tax=Nocardiopsis ansamitocini TaxID=1670832 RepID=A0A9W6UH14_9ACTN|nr:GNAT family N-acetyltransferase [Nocardiopsis ansamitocini]GLU46262.1 N-acetyltransferase [Nocardiopsis ansamitocini]
MSELTVVDVPESKRFEAHQDGALAGFADYIRTAELITFTHTEVDPAFEGKGVGSALVRASLDAARAEGLPVLPVCPFYQGWIARHREYADVLYGTTAD